MLISEEDLENIQFGYPQAITELGPQMTESDQGKSTPKESINQSKIKSAKEEAATTQAAANVD